MKTSNRYLKNFISLCLTGGLLVTGVALTAQTSETKDVLKKKKDFRNQIEIGYTGGYYFDGEGYKMSQRSIPNVHSLVHGVPAINFSLSYKRLLRKDDRFIDMKITGLKYADMTGPNSQWIRQEYITLMGSISYGKNFAIKKKKNVEFVPHYSFDLSYRLGAENGGSLDGLVFIREYHGPYRNPGIDYNSPGLGASLGADIVLFRRFSIGTEGSYNHFFFQKGKFDEVGNEQVNKDLFVQHFKIGWLF